ncbi:MAG: HAD-IIA family hydrolase [Phycisphaerae bacterium]|jgi:HAD superfamily hydrolase (TIGR01450 family)
MKVRGLLLDVEGVLVADKRYTAVETAVEFVAAARAAGCPLRLITNNTTDDRPAIIQKLTAAGFDFRLEELHTCISAAIRRLGELSAHRLLVLGTNALRGVFAEAGFTVADDSRVDAVVVGLDRALIYERLAVACEAIVTHRAALVALHKNRVLADPSGRVAPSVGSIVAAIEYATGADAIVIGKPDPAYYQQALDDLGLPPADVIVISDDPLSDLAGARRMGMAAALVLSGKYHDPAITDSLPAGERPQLVAPRIGDLLHGGGIELV